MPLDRLNSALRYFSVVACVLAMHACTTAQPPIPGVTATGAAAGSAVLPLVFIPGLMGSMLKDSAGRTRWLTAGEGLGLKTPDLGLPLNWNDGVQQRDDLAPAGIVMDVSLIPGLIGQDVYAPWADFATNIKDRPLHIFSYDWRRDNNESSARFEEYLDQLSREYGGKKIQVVAHSMGGMITLSVMNRRPELFDRVVFTGTPFRGGIGYLDNMYSGTPIGINNSLLGPEVLFSHASVYSFYPAGQAFENTDIVQDETGAPLALNFYDPAVWQANGFGPFAPASTDWRGNAEERLKFLSAVLKQGRLFRTAMLPKFAADKYPPVLVVGSKSHGTLAFTRRKPVSSSAGPKTEAKDPNIPEWDFANTTREAGDGTVRYRDMLPPEPIRHDVVLSKYSHSYLLNDPEMQTEIARFLHATSEEH